MLFLLLDFDVIVLILNGLVILCCCIVRYKENNVFCVDVLVSILLCF